jgi:hypothetical protein
VSVSKEEFQKEKQACIAIAGSLGKDSQAGVIQFGSKAELTVGLTPNIQTLADAVNGMY